ncbi:MAG: Nramp family divalent metal transporter [Pyrinomonadaceae bacterium]
MLTRLKQTGYFQSVRTMFLRARRYFSEYRFFAYLAILGPGMIAANAGNDASGIATYSSIGAAFGYEMLWAFLPMMLGLIIVQEMCVRMGVVTGQGLADLIREQFGVRWTVFIMAAILIANAGVIISEFVGIAQASDLLGVPRQFVIPIAAGTIWWLVVKGSHRRLEKIFLAMSLVFLCYVASAILAQPDWSQAVEGLFTPTVSQDSFFLFALVAMIGTTITPFMQIYVQSSIVEKGLDADDLPLARADVVVGTVFACVIAFFIVVSTAATLHEAGITRIDSAATAATALAPFAGEYAKYFFAIGLFGAAMLAMGVLPLATAYSLSEALGFEKGVSRSFREAPIFVGIFTALLLTGALVSLIPGIPQIQLLLLTQCINGLLLPVLLFAILRLVNNKEIMVDHCNGTWMNISAFAVAIIVSLLSLLLIGKTIVDMF